MDMDFTLLFWILVALVTLFLTIFALLVYSGLFASIDVGAGKPPFGEISVAYKFARGPYRNAGELFTEAHILTPELQCIGLYYDDPQQVAPSDLRYAVGVVLHPGRPTPDSDDPNEKVLTENGYKLIAFPAISHAVTTTFPFKNTVSIYLAVAKVYPKLTEYISEKKLCAHPFIELYDEDIIHFVAPLSQQDDFYVPESKDDQSDEEGSHESREGSPLVEEIGDESTELLRGAGELSLGHSAVETDLLGNLNEKEEEEDVPQPKETTNNGGSSSAEESNGSSFEELNGEDH
jgi:hypothetical protein